jgi:hypothetical protein
MRASRVGFRRGPEGRGRSVGKERGDRRRGVVARCGGWLGAPVRCQQPSLPLSVRFGLERGGGLPLRVVHSRSVACPPVTPPTLPIYYTYIHSVRASLNPACLPSIQLSSETTVPMNRRIPTGSIGLILRISGIWMHQILDGSMTIRGIGQKHFAHEVLNQIRRRAFALPCLFSYHCKDTMILIFQ